MTNQCMSIATKIKLIKNDWDSDSNWFNDLAEDMKEPAKGELKQ